MPAIYNLYLKLKFIIPKERTNSKEYKNMETIFSICEKCKNYFFTDENNVTQGFVRLETCKKEHFNKLIKKLRTEEVLTCKDFEEI